MATAEGESVSGSEPGRLRRPTSLLETMKKNPKQPQAAAVASSSSSSSSVMARNSYMNAAALSPAPPIPSHSSSSAPTSMSFVLAHLLRRGHDMSIAHLVMQDLVQAGRGVTFEDVAALSEAKRLLHEAIILPTIVPEFFTGIRSPWKVTTLQTNHQLVE